MSNKQQAWVNTNATESAVCVCPQAHGEVSRSRWASACKQFMVCWCGRVSGVARALSVEISMRRAQRCYNIADLMYAGWI